MARRPVEYFFETADRWPANEFLHIPAYDAGGVVREAKSYTYSAAQRQIEALAHEYAEQGVAEGFRVGLILENNAAFFLHWLALNQLGISIVPLNKELEAEDCAHIIRDSGLSLIVCFPDLASVVEAAASKVDHSVPVWKVGGEGMPLLTAKSVAEPDECALLYTSGSTGLPKGCVLSNEYFEVAGQEYMALGGLCALVEGAERLVTPLPLVHMNALACSTMAMIMTGGCIIQLDRFHPKTWWQTVVDTQATVIHYLGVMPAILLLLEEAEAETKHQVKFGFGAGVNPKHHQKFEGRFGFPLVEGWSMTEVGGAAWVIASSEPRHVAQCCFGKPSERVEYRIVNDTGELVSAGQSGELLVRRAGLNPREGFFSGYYGQPELSAEAWQGGWFHTGDIVKADAEGSLYFVDRKKSIIRRSGENISALEIEAALSELPYLTAIGVCPVPDEIRGEEVAACVVVEGVKADDELAAKISEHVLTKLAYFKAPGYVAFVDSLPLTASQKLQRGELKKIAASIVSDGKAIDLRHLKKRRKAS